MTFEFEEQKQEEYKYLKRFMLQPIVSNPYYDVLEAGGDLYNEMPKYCFVQTYNKDDALIWSGYFLLSPTWYSCGKTNVIQMAMEDNFNVGTAVSSITALEGLLNVQVLVPYVDNYGEFKKMTIELRSSTPSDFAADWIDGNVPFDLFYETANNLPYVYEHEIGNFASNYVLVAEKVLYKDNRETTSISMNFNFKDTEHIIIGNIADYTGIGHNDNSIRDLKVVYSTKDYYELGDMYGLGETSEYVRINDVDYNQYMNNGTLFSRIRIEALNGTNGWKSWGLCDKDGNLIVGVNNPYGSYNIPTSIYLKCEKKDY